MHSADFHPGLEEFETSVQTDLVIAPAEEKQLTLNSIFI